MVEPQSVDDVYNYNNEWRGETVTPMAANIQWDVATRDGIDPETRQGLHPADPHAVQRGGGCIRRHHTLARGLSSCTPVAEGSTWYKNPS